jgi:hypothetical protein
MSCVQRLEQIKAFPAAHFSGNNLVRRWRKEALSRSRTVPAGIPVVHGAFQAH